MSTVYLHDGSLEGLLHAVALAVKSKQMVKGIYAAKGYSPELFDSLISLETDKAQAFRVFEYLKKLNDSAVGFALNGFLSEDRDVGIHLYWMVRECLARGPEATQLYTHDSIRYLERLARKVNNEVHKFTGLLRFRILSDGLQYAPFEPDCNVIGYCANHFVRRLRQQHWVLHDVRRDYALFWDGEQLQGIDVDEAFTTYVRGNGEVPDSQLSQEEQYYQDLWKSFHQVIANKDRENLKLQRQFMPQRYWKYMVEMQP